MSWFTFDEAGDLHAAVWSELLAQGPGDPGQLRGQVLRVRRAGQSAVLTLYLAPPWPTDDLAQRCESLSAALYLELRTESRPSAGWSLRLSAPELRRLPQPEYLKPAAVKARGLGAPLRGTVFEVALALPAGWWAARQEMRRLKKQFFRHDAVVLDPHFL